MLSMRPILRGSKTSKLVHFLGLDDRKKVRDSGIVNVFASECLSRDTVTYCVREPLLRQNGGCDL